MRLAKWLTPVLGGAVWTGSWYLMYLEISRWHHVKPSLAFNPDIAPGARPGAPLILLYAACVAGPFVTLAGVVAQTRVQFPVSRRRAVDFPARRSSSA